MMKRKNCLKIRGGGIGLSARCSDLIPVLNPEGGASYV